MQLYLRNQINVDGQAEVIEQSYPVEVTEKMVFLIWSLQMRKMRKLL